MSTLTYLCPCCNKGPDAALKSISDIGFSLRNPFYSMLIDAVEKKASQSAELSTNMEKVLKNLGTNELFRYLGPKDIRALFPDKPEHCIRYRGKMTVTCAWVKKKARIAWANRKKDQDYENIPFPENDFPGDNTILYEDEYQLFYHYVDGVYVPKKIQCMKEHDTDGKSYSSAMRRCSCGRILSPFTGTAKEIIIVMQGSSRAGKSTTMVALEHILKHSNLEDGSPIYIEYNLQHVEPEEIQLSWFKLQDEAYSQCRKIDKTKKEKNYEELLFSFKLFVNNHPYILTLVDMAGEIFDGDKSLGAYWYKNYSYIYQHCDAIWTSVPYQTLDSSRLDPDFLLRHYRYYRSRPEQYDLDLTAWKEEASYPHELPSHAEFVEDISDAIGSGDLDAMLERYAPIHAARMLAALGETNAALANADLETYQQRLEDMALILPENRPPHAVILTKTDSIADLFTAGDENARQELDELYIYPAVRQQHDSVMHYYGSRQKNRHYFKYDTDESMLSFDACTGTAALSEEAVNRVCRNVRKFFARTDPLRVRIFHDLCPGKTCEFALSAYGRKPSHSQNIKPRPYNIALPLLWTLAVIGILPVSYVQTSVRMRTPEEIAAEGIGLVVTEAPVVRTATDDPISMENLYANKKTYTFHESKP